MDELDEQLRQLSLINSRLSCTDNDGETSADGGNHIDVAKLISSIEKKNNLSQDYQGSLRNRLIYDNELSASKKIGPLVPPKPLKKPSNLAEIPQSSLVKQTCEPLYAQRLQSSDGNNYATGEISKQQPLLLRKQSSYASHEIDSALNSPSSLYFKTNRKVTLDNPAVLEQQLEALEHHKKQMERCGKLNQNSNNCKTLPTNINTLKLSSASLITDVDINFLENSNATYANANTTSGAVGSNSNPNVYANVMPSLYKFNNMYSNLSYDKDQQEQKPTAQIQHLIKKPAPLGSDEKNSFFSQKGSQIPEDEIPPPPSPVSSSYSELRRATEVFNTNNISKKGVLTANDQTDITKPFDGYEMPHDHKLSSTLNHMGQLYMNKPYVADNAFNNYNPAAQAKNTQHFPDYYGYGGFSQRQPKSSSSMNNRSAVIDGLLNSSTYESIYEPINPRPSQLSTRSYNPLYPAGAKNSSTSTLPECVGGLEKSSSSNLSTLSGLSGGSSVDSISPIYPNNRGGAGSGAGENLNNCPQNPKESEVESLTDFLVNSMSPQQDLENYGICFKCNEIVVGENSGCTAMDQIYHITCFTCSQCQINLQGKPFYALDCKPYCEFDYLQTLEKCSVCMKPILERILRATGKPYHPQCFTCAVCKKSLDGIPFTVDATNQNYCIEDFHKKFAPRCCVCKEPIMPEPGEEETVRVVALDRSFHFECYKCEDCGFLLSSDAEGRGCYPLDNHVLCQSCNAKRVQMLTNRMTTTEL